MQYCLSVVIPLILTIRYSNTTAADDLFFQVSSDGLFSDPMVLEETAKSLSELERSDLALFMTIAEDTMALPPMPDPQYFQAMPHQVQTDTSNLDWVLNTVAEDGRPTFTCLQCLKTHDRKTRARDCRNNDLKIKPYKCLGGCGNGNWFVKLASGHPNHTTDHCTALKVTLSNSSSLVTALLNTRNATNGTSWPHQ
jgi:hypothetical protein